MIERVTFKNFKALRNVAIELAPFTLIIGPNASGKTSILEGLDCLAQLAHVKPRALFVGPRRLNVLRSWGAEEAVELELRGAWAGYQGQVLLRATERDSESWQFETNADWQSRDGVAKYGASAEWAKGWGLPAQAHSSTPGTVLLRLDPARLGAPSYSVDKVPQVGVDGSNLPSVLADLAITSPSGFQELQARLRTVVPSFKSLGFDRVSIEKEDYWPSDNVPGLYEQGRTKYIGYGLKLNFSGSEELPAHAVSEGTLITLGLLTVLARPPVPRLVLVDELERGLHPKALGELIRQMRALMECFPETQIIGTTHSPYLVDHFQPNEVVLTALRDDGSVAAGTLNEHPEFDRWKDEMKPGEFWSTVGEDWLLKRKAPDAG
jgi:energy-coupling factor transporter ATP-binding protein EcfA2